MVFIMKKCGVLLIVIILFITAGQVSKAAQASSGAFGIGIMLGDPTGLTAKYWLSNENALAFSLGNSYLGSLRFGFDYLWHFDAFHSNVVKLYAGPGLAVGFGRSGGWLYNNEGSRWYRADNNFGLGARGVFGVNIVPRRTPLEFFAELGLMIGLSPAFYTNVEGAVGFRFYF